MDPTQIELLPEPQPAPPPRLILQPGIHRGVPRSVYLGDPADRPSLSNSIAQLLLRCPSAAQLAHPRLGGVSRPSTGPMRKGSLLDALILGGEAEIAVIPEELPDADGKMKPTKGELRMKSAKAWAESAEAAGKVVTSAEALAEARDTAERIRENFLGRWGLEFAGENQLVLVWVDDGGVLCRGRLDHVLTSGLPIESTAAVDVIDLKTIENAHPDELANHMHRYGYDVQAAAYTKAIEILRPELAGRVTFKFAFAETTGRCETVVVPPAASMRELGAWKWDRAVRLWSECLSTGHWPGYTVPPGGIEAKPWALDAMMSSAAGGSAGVGF
jgi:hypothetical protein